MKTPQSEAERRLAATSRRSAIISLAGFLIAASAIVYSFVQITRLETTKKDLERQKTQLETDNRALIEKKTSLAAEIDEKQKRLDDLNAQAAHLEQDNQDKQETIDRVRIHLATDDLGAAKETLASEPAPSEAPTRRPRVYFQIRSASQIGVYQQCARALRAIGFDVPKQEILPDKGPASSEVRYFRKTDKDQGEQIAAAIRPFPVGATTVKYVGGHEDSKLMRLRHFEVWLAAKKQ